MNDFIIKEVFEKEEIETIIETLFGNLVYSDLKAILKGREIDFSAISKKLSDFGVVIAHYYGKKPVSVMAGYANNQKTKTAYIYLVGVLYKYRRKHLGTESLIKFETYAKNQGMEKVSLQVLKENTTAISFYKHFGYKIVGNAGEIRYYMEKSL